MGRAILDRLVGPQLANTSRRLWNQKSYYHVYKTPLLARVLSLVNLAQVFQFCCFKSILILFSHSRPDLPSGPFPSASPLPLSKSAASATCRFYFFLSDLMAQILFSNEYISPPASIRTQFPPSPCLSQHTMSTPSG